MEKEDQQVAFLALKFNSTGMSAQEAKHTIMMLKLVREIQTLLNKLQKTHKLAIDLKILNVSQPLESCKFELIKAFVGIHKVYTDPEAKECLVAALHTKLAQIREKNQKKEA